jgi:hypothetical protein
MKLFIFEPYNWDYCGGAIGVISDSFENAVDLIIETNRKLTAESDRIGYEYEKEFFSETPKNFKEDHWDQWLLTEAIKVPDEEKPRVVFDNWNYG